MALSDYDTLAVDLDGNPTNGTFIDPRTGVSVSFYKTWLYVRDPDFVVGKPNQFTENTVASIDSGSLSYRGIQIEAIHGPQNGIYAVVYSTDYSDAKNPKHYGMIGCGVYGYHNDCDKLMMNYYLNTLEEQVVFAGVSEECIQFLENWIHRKTTLEEEIAYVEERNPDYAGKKGSPEWQDMYDSLMEGHQPKFVMDDYIASVQLDRERILRFNQGDKYFAEQLDNPDLSNPND